MKKQLFVFVFVMLIFTSILTAQNIKIASIAPESTPWGQGLNRMAAQWSQITNGRVRVTVFHGGVLGDEADSIRKMRIGQIQGAALTTLGIAQIEPRILGLSFPGIVENDEEMNFVLSHFAGDLSAFFNEQGYEAMAWSHSGWLNLFSTSPIQSIADLQGRKMATSTIPEDLNPVFRNLGMQPVPVASPEILSGLNSGLIDTILYAPLGVAGYQWFGVAANMLDMRISPFLGAILIDQRTWARIPEMYRDELKEIAAQIGVEIQQEFGSLEGDAMDLMRRYGLQVQQVSEDQRDLWLSEFSRQAELEGGQFLHNDFIENVTRELEFMRE